MQKTEDKIRAIGTVLTWLLGFLALIIGALVSFIFQDLSTIIAVNNFPTLKHAVLFLLAIYSITAVITLWGLAVSFVYSGETAKELKNSLERLKSILEWDIILAILTVFIVLGFTSYFLYGSFFLTFS